MAVLKIIIVSTQKANDASDRAHDGRHRRHGTQITCPIRSFNFASSLVLASSVTVSSVKVILPAVILFELHNSTILPVDVHGSFDGCIHRDSFYLRTAAINRIFAGDFVVYHTSPKSFWRSRFLWTTVFLRLYTLGVCCDCHGCWWGKVLFFLKTETVDWLLGRIHVSRMMLYQAVLCCRRNLSFSECSMNV